MHLNTRNYQTAYSLYERIIDFQMFILLKHIFAEVFQEVAPMQYKKNESNFKIDGIILSKSESAVLYYLIRGKTAKGIAEAVHLSNRTVEIHLTNLKDKLNCKNKSELIEKALDSGFYEQYEC